MVRFGFLVAVVLMLAGCGLPHYSRAEVNVLADRMDKLRPGMSSEEVNKTLDLNLKHISFAGNAGGSSRNFWVTYQLREDCLLMIVSDIPAHQVKSVELYSPPKAVHQVYKKIILVPDTAPPRS